MNQPEGGGLSIIYRSVMIIVKFIYFGSIARWLEISIFGLIYTITKSHYIIIHKLKFTISTIRIISMYIESIFLFT